MEPNTQPTIVSPMTNKNKKMLIIIAIIVVVIIIAFLLKSKVNTPVNTEAPLSATKQLSKDIDDATTFDNEADLKEIDKEFQ